MDDSKNRDIEGVTLRFAKVGALTAGEEVTVRAMMSPEERERCDRFRHEPSRQCYLITRKLVRTALTELGGKSPEYWRFEQEGQGRPYLENPTEKLRGIDFNIAHSSKMVVLATRRGGRVGVDIEPVDRQVDHGLVARQFFNESEKKALTALDDKGRSRRFLELWVLKEAWMKADGRGIGAGLKQVVYRFEADGTPNLSALPDDDPSRWQVVLTETDRHLLGLAFPRQER